MSFSNLRLFTPFPFWNSGFLAASLPQRPFLIKLLRTVEGSTWHPDEAARCWARSLLDILWSLKEETYWKLLSQILKVFLASSPVTSLTFLHNSLNTTFWVSQFVCGFPFESGLADAKLWFYVCQILWSLTFWMEWCDWKLVSYKLASFQWVKLIQHVYVMLKHVLRKPGVIDLFQSSHFDTK